MYPAPGCPCCLSAKADRYPAVVAPFIGEYALRGAAPEVWLIECPDCSHRYFDMRFDADEAQRLYSKYRSEEYFLARNKHEFWYSRAINDNIGGDQRNIDARKAYLQDFLSDQFGRDSLPSILDYGGDSGQFIPDGIARKKFVFEVSNATPRPEVTKIGSDSELRQLAPFPLIMLCHVLEHLAEPAETIAQVRELLAFDNAWLLVEVPYERYTLRHRRMAPLVVKRLIHHSRIARTLNEIYTLYFRTRWKTIPPFGLPRLHEHINFYSPESLSRLLVRAGFDVVKHRVADVDTSVGLSSVLLMLARIRNE